MTDGVIFSTDSDAVVDVTDLIDALRISFVRWGEDYAYSTAIAVPGLIWLGLPVVSTVVRFIIRSVLSAVAKSAIMEAFFLNTAVKKAAQASDYIGAVKAKNELPPTTSDEDYEHAERAEMVAFRLFVMVGSK